MRTRVYIAGPISKGALEDNIRQATEAALSLIRAGYAPLCPHLSCFMGGHLPQVLPGGTTADDWYEADLPWVAVADAVLRLPGESLGADLEVECAAEAGIPIFHDLAEIHDKLPREQPAAGHPGYLRLLREMAALHRRKAADYGSDKDPLANIRASAEVGIEPWRAAWLRAKDKVKRIDAYCLKGSLANESVEDSFMDLAAYCLIALAIRRDPLGPPF
jgi:hypothetical protein